MRAASPRRAAAPETRMPTSLEDAAALDPVAAGALAELLAPVAMVAELGAAVDVDEELVEMETVGRPL